MKRLLIAAVVLLAVGIACAVLWTGVLAPRTARLYAQAVEQYSNGDFRSAADTLERARQWNPGNAKVNTLLGWSYWRLGEPGKAEARFSRAYRADRSAEDAKLGLAFASMAMDHVSVALPLFQELNSAHPGDSEVRAALARAYVLVGQNLKAAQLYRDWLELDPNNEAARRELLQMFGYPEYRPELSLTLPSRARPAETQLYFRAHGDFLQALSDGRWNDIYPLGVNIGPARPGEFPSTASRDFSTYETWFGQIADMHANTVRVYTILPPAFYQALLAFNQRARTPLWLVQEVWIEDDAEDLYDKATEQQFQRELRSTIDVVHGSADVPYRRGHNYGVYTADVSRWVLGLAVGREVEPRLVLVTNKNHSEQTHYQGRYVSLKQGSAAETWFARMCDTAAAYEAEHYNAQRPLTVVNWPPLDPMTHSTEANYVDELRMRKKLGEAVPSDVPKEINDADAVSLDVAKFRPEPAFTAGLFALYHVYQHWPDFLLHEPSYAEAKDSEGTNRYLGYLRELKNAYRGFPLLVGEYGISTSTAPAHVHPEGWNNGGLSEKQQAELLARFTRNIHDTGYAGSVVFEWQDEWWKHVHDSFTADFEQPWDRNPYWLNRLDPEKQFGLVGYMPSTAVPLLRGNPEDWADAQQLSTETAQSAPGHLRALYATSDFAYLYLRVDIVPGTVDWKQANYWVALNTLPGESGSRLLPGIGVRLEQGANFLVQLDGPASAKILIAQNYNPNRPFPVPGRPGRSRIWRKQGMPIALANSAQFEDILIEANPVRYGRDGTEFPAINYDRSSLPFGTADPAQRDFSSEAAWNMDSKRGMIEMRIPWGLLLFNDPSQRAAFGGTDQQWRPLSRPTRGIAVAAFEIRLGDRKDVVSALPALQNETVIPAAPVYSWKAWTVMETRPYFKQSYYVLQKLFGGFASAEPSKR
ncbi:MAG: tetratricopeptide repeat protein [Terriglobales bacterium]